jgi:outer membrane immunogenic protein
MLRALLAILCLVVAGSASNDAKAASTQFSWSGWYISGSGGWGWRSKTDYPPTSYYTGLGANFAAGAGYGGSSGGGQTPRYNGLTAAFGVGYNYQLSPMFVIGADYEFMYADLQTNPTSSMTSFSKGTGIFAPAYTVTNYDSVDGDANRWYGIARLRAGVPIMNRALFYFTGGAAYRLSYASQTPSITTYNYSFGGTTYSTVSYPNINTSHAWGWVAGLGLEYALTDSFFVRSEWIHMDFGSATYLDPVATALTGTPSLLQFRRTADILRGGLTYRFSAGGY